MNHDECCDAFDVEVERFAAAFEVANTELRVPSCPDWSVEELALHLGTIHRWAERLVATRARERVAATAMDLDLGPVNAEWLRRGGESLAATLREANASDPMWAWGVDQHVRFWSRRQLHETLIHRVDLELALSVDIEIDDAVACDAVSEFLVNLGSSARFSPKVRELRGDGERLRFSAPNQSAAWTIELLPDGLALTDSMLNVDVELTGAIDELLLVLYRRRALHDSALYVQGDRELLTRWVDHSMLE